MKKNLLLIACLLGFLTQVSAQSISDHYAHLSKAVVKIVVSGQDIQKETLQKVTNQGVGSGVLISEDGLVLTASHVVQTANSVHVEFIDGETIPAHVVSSAPFADVATIQLAWKPKGKVVAKLGNSDSVRIGDEVFMIGAPYGLDFSLSVGYISGRHKKRRFSHGEQYMEFFQTDASINHGNSGGPMINMNGEVIGVASYILSESGGFQGLGFAATSNVCHQLLLDERNVWTGMEGIFVSDQLAAALNVPQSSGLLVQKVTFMSPLGILGVQGGEIPIDIAGETIIIGGDVILSVDGIPLINEDNLEQVRIDLGNLKSGDTYTITVWRGGHKEKLKGKAQ